MVVVMFVVVEGVFKVCLAAQPVKRMAAVMYFIMILVLCGLIFLFSDGDRQRVLLSLICSEIRQTDIAIIITQIFK